MAGLYHIMDTILCLGLEVDLETYNRIIDCECTEEEAYFIITTFLKYDEDNFEKAKEIFNKYLNE
jgi:hypothetical protein